MDHVSGIRVLGTKMGSVVKKINHVMNQGDACMAFDTSI